MFFLPFPPLNIFGVNLGKPPLEIFPLNALEPFFIRVPQRTGFFIIQYKNIIVCPSRRGDRQRSAVNPAAVHSR